MPRVRVDYYNYVYARQESRCWHEVDHLVPLSAKHQLSRPFSLTVGVLSVAVRADLFATHLALDPNPTEDDGLAITTSRK